MAKSISVGSIVADYMAKYDHNRNGVIDIKRPAGFWDKVKNPDERVRSKTVMTPGMERDTLTMSTQVYSIDRLLYAADKNSDGQVTRQELEAAVKRYDTNKDDQLSYRGFLGFLTRKPKQDGDIFNAEMGERMTRYSQVNI